MAGSASPPISKPLWLLAELSYRCPLQCPYCSNPIDFAAQRDELTTDQWLDVLRQARALGAAQLGFSGGEPLLRKDLEQLVGEGRKLGYYTNLITSGIGMDEARLSNLKKLGLDHIQLSFQASSKELNDRFAGTESFDHKLNLARMIKKYEYPMVLNVVLHRQNIDQIGQILEMALSLGADYIELANTQYYGWAFVNRAALMPTREQVERAEETTRQFREQYGDRMRTLFVVPDYFEERPKPCMDGWGSVFLAIAPDGVALPCHAARQLPGLDLPNVRGRDLKWIWYESPAFNAFRGEDWMQEPCRTCPERSVDYGGCHCQAYMLSGDARNTDPVCGLSPHHDRVLAALDEAPEAEFVFRNARNSRELSG